MTEDAARRGASGRESDVGLSVAFPEAYRREMTLRRDLARAIGTVDDAAAEIALMSSRLSQAVTRADEEIALMSGRLSQVAARADVLDRNVETLRHENVELHRLVEHYRRKADLAFAAWQARGTELLRMKSG